MIELLLSVKIMLTLATSLPAPQTNLHLRQPQPLHYSGTVALPVYTRTRDRWPDFTVTPGATIEWSGEYYDEDNRQWWVFVQVPNTDLAGWIVYTDTLRMKQ